MRLFMMFCVMLLLAGCDTRTSVERAQEEGVLIVGNNAEPQSFDPHIATSVSDFKIINAVMEGLLRGDSRDDAAFHPAVAESWTHNPEADKWRFSLRKDAVWSDGVPVTAHDFVYAYHRLLHPEFGGRYADMLYPLKNAEAYNRNRRSLLLCGPGSRLAGEAGLDGEALARVDWERLDGMGARELEALRKDISRMEWPDGMPEEGARRIAARMLEDVRAGRPDLWEEAVWAYAPRTIIPWSWKCVLRCPSFPCCCFIAPGFRFPAMRWKPTAACWTGRGAGRGPARLWGMVLF